MGDVVSGIGGEVEGPHLIQWKSEFVKNGCRLLFLIEIAVQRVTYGLVTDDELPVNAARQVFVAEQVFQLIIQVNGYAFQPDGSAAPQGQTMVLHKVAGGSQQGQIDARVDVDRMFCIDKLLVINIKIIKINSKIL